jgi:hypothetical protein
MNSNQKPAVQQPQQGSFPQTTTVNQPGVNYPTGMAGTPKQQVVTGQVPSKVTGGYPATGGYQVQPGYTTQGNYLPTPYNYQPRPPVVGQTYAPQVMTTQPQKFQPTYVQRGPVPVQVGATYPVGTFPQYQQKPIGNVGVPINTGLQQRIATNPVGQQAPVANGAQGSTQVNTAPKVAQQVPTNNTSQPVQNASTQPTTAANTTAEVKTTAGQPTQNVQPTTTVQPTVQPSTVQPPTGTTQTTQPSTQPPSQATNQPSTQPPVINPPKPFDRKNIAPGLMD